MDKGMRHCLKQTFARCQSSKFFPGVDEYVKMCRKPATLQRHKPGMGALFFYKNSSIKLPKRQKKQVQIRMWSYDQTDTHTHASHIRFINQFFFYFVGLAS